MSVNYLIFSSLMFHQSFSLHTKFLFIPLYSLPPAVTVPTPVWLWTESDSVQTGSPVVTVLLHARNQTQPVSWVGDQSHLIAEMVKLLYYVGTKWSNNNWSMHGQQFIKREKWFGKINSPTVTIRSGIQSKCLLSFKYNSNSNLTFIALNLHWVVDSKAQQDHSVNRWIMLEWAKRNEA